MKQYCTILLVALLSTSACNSCENDDPQTGTDTGTQQDAATDEDTGSADMGTDASGPDDTGPAVDMAPNEDMNPGEDTAVDPGFALSADRDTIRVPRGGSTSLTLTVERVGGFNSDITIAANGLPGAIGSDTLTLSIASDEVTMNFDALANADEGGPDSFSIRAVSNDDASISSEIDLQAYVTGEPGAFDQSFAGDGTTSLNVTDEYDAVRDLDVDARGRVVLGGVSQGGMGWGGFLVRLSDGLLDQSFGTGGQILDFGGPESEVSRVAMNGNGMVVGVRRSTEPYLRSYDENGDVDATFGNDGDVVLPDSYFGPYAWGERYALYDRDLGVLAYDSTGQEVDVDVATPLPFYPLQAVSDGTRLLIGGGDGSTRQFNVMAIASDGTVDDTFADNGVLTLDPPPTESISDTPGMAIGPDGGGALLVDSGYGDIYQNNVIVYGFGPDGSPNTNLGPGGQLIVYDEGVGEHVAIQDDGKIVVTYHERVSDMSIDSKIVRFNTDGSLDTSFGNGGYVDPDLIVSRVVHDRDGGRLILVFATPELDVARIWL